MKNFTILTILTIALTSCGPGNETAAERISCKNMQVLASENLLPVTQAEQDQLRLAFAQSVSAELQLGLPLVMSPCDLTP